MGYYSSLQKLRYKWYAKNRHGVHSPFVYNFVEIILNGKNICKSDESFSAHFPKDLSERQTTILSRIIRHYELSEIVVDNSSVLTLNADENGRLLLFGALNDTSANFAEKDFAIVFDIHQNKSNSILWSQFYKSPPVRTSFDLFDMGIVLFRPEFKVNQHFILK